ncbi:MAG: hypothetical protein Q8P95_01815 [bacterium]|nr:hypothetical protein [bacterium]
MRAYSTIIAVILLLSFIVIVVAGLTSFSISRLQSELSTEQSQTTQQYAQTCIEEVLRHLKDTISYAGGAISLPDGASCTASVIGTDTNKTITATVSDQNIQQIVTAEVTVTTNGEAINLELTNWSEN